MPESVTRRALTAGARLAFRRRCWCVIAARAPRRVRSAGTGGTKAQDKAGHCRVAVAISRAQVDRIDCSAGWAAHPQEPIAGGDGDAVRSLRSFETDS